MTYPTIRPALTLDFAKTQRLDPRITFSRSSDGTYIDSDGLIKTAPDGVARFEYDSNGKCLGLLIEDSRTNLWINSDDPTFVAVNGIVTPSAALAPDGTNTASVFVPNAASDSTDRYLIIPQPNTLSTLQVVTFHVKTTYSHLAFFASAQGTQSNVSVNVGINLSTNSVYQTTEANGIYSSTSIVDMANGYKRISIAYQTDGGIGGKQPGIIVSDTEFVISGNPGRAIDQTANYTTDGAKSLTIWGVQLETGSFPTSYIPTAGSTVTRAVDLATMPTAGIYGDEFTIVNKDFGTAGGSDTLTIVGPNTERTVTYPAYLTQTEINEVATGDDDDFLRMRVLGSSFALTGFRTDGSLTVDWGDGTVETLTTAEHTFSNGSGYHEIGFRLDSGTYFSPNFNGNVTNAEKVISVGPFPSNMLLEFRPFGLCRNMEVCDATFAHTGTSAQFLFRQNRKLKSIPFFTTTATSLSDAFNDCEEITSFPLIDTSSVTDFTRAWRDCDSLTSFPLINTSSGVSFNTTWQNCTSLTSFPANFFNSWTGTPADNCFFNAWNGCTSLSATSVENILNSIDTSGQSAPAAGVDITIDYDAGSGTPSISTAVTNLKSRGWTITLNGVAQ